MTKPYDAEIPASFERLFRTSPFLDTLGPFFYRRTEQGFVIGLQVADKHANARGSAHGGLLLTLADIALGYTAAASEDPPLALTTVNISADFVGHARVGDWLEAQVDIQKIGRRLVFANVSRGRSGTHREGERDLRSQCPVMRAACSMTCANLSHRVAIISGATRGIGSAEARRSSAPLPASYLATSSTSREHVSRASSTPSAVKRAHAMSTWTQLGLPIGPTPCASLKQLWSF
jgi:acyl-coenzyme A thioesterase 13